MNPTYENLETAIAVFKKNPDTRTAVKIEGAIALAKRIAQYQSKNPKPIETPSRNIAPENGISGQSPNSITDPVKRTKYEKELQHNKDLAQQLSRHTRMANALESVLSDLIQMRKSSDAMRIQIDSATDKEELPSELKSRLRDASKSGG